MVKTLAQVPNLVAATTEKLIAWLHDFWEAERRGAPMEPDPMYSRNAELTPEVVDRIVEGIEGVFTHEIMASPKYHADRVGTSYDGTPEGARALLVPPGWTSASPTKKLALAQGVDRIMEAARAEALAYTGPPAPTVVSYSAEYYGAEYYWE